DQPGVDLAGVRVGEDRGETLVERARPAVGTVGIVLSAAPSTGKGGPFACAPGADVDAIGVPKGEHPDEGAARTGSGVTLKPGPAVATDVVTLHGDAAGLGHLAARTHNEF